MGGSNVTSGAGAPGFGSAMVNSSPKVPWLVATNWAWIRSVVTVNFMNPWVRSMFEPMIARKAPASESFAFMGRRPMPSVPAMTTTGPAPFT